MKKMISLFVAGIMAMSTITNAAVVLNTTIVNETSLAHNATYAVDLQGLKLVDLAGQAIFTSAATSLSLIHI